MFSQISLSHPPDPTFQPQPLVERESESRSVMSNSVTPWTARLLCPWNSLSKKSGVSCHSLLQGIFPTQGSNPGLQHCRQILYHWSHQRGYVIACILSLLCFSCQRLGKILQYKEKQTGQVSQNICYNLKFLNIQAYLNMHRKYICQKY